MNGFVALPLIAALVVALTGSRRLGRLRPAAAARCHAVLITAVGIAAIPTLWLIGLSGLAHAGIVNPITDWSTHILPDHRPVGAGIGFASLGMAVSGAVRVARVLLHHRRIRTTDTDPIVHIDTSEVFAYTLPGPAGTIAISEGLRTTLDAEEFGFVVAHERAHARHRHDRFKLLGLLAAAFVPPIAGATRRLEFQLERWADEEALVHTGAARDVAARTIAKVALAGANPQASLGIAEHGIAARAQAMLGPVERPGASSRAITTTVLTSTLALAMYQLHHTAMFAVELTG